MGSLWVLSMDTRGGNATEAPRARRVRRHVCIGVLGVDACKLKRVFCVCIVSLRSSLLGFNVFSVIARVK